MHYEKKILNLLVDKYEKSKSFTGDNQKQQTFALNLMKCFPAYGDHSDYEAFSEINEAVRYLDRENYIILKRKGTLIEKVVLNTVVIDAIYAYLQRKPKSLRNTTIRNMLMKYQDKNPILTAYCKEQSERLDQNKPVLWLGDGAVAELENLLMAVSEVLKLEDETYIRDFSVKVFGDSKVFEKLSNRITGLLYTYGNFSERSRVLEELNLVKNPTYIHLKGPLKLSLGNQILNISGLSGDLALSATLLREVGQLELTGIGVRTVENLTSFYTQSCENHLIIYLGGFHNTVSREFLKKLYEQNPNVIYEHFGDIDAGGLYILEHLKKMTGIPFEPYKMDIETLKQYKAYTKQLTPQDEKRLVNFLDSPYGELAAYMLENHCKLEQEAILVY